MTMDVPDSRSSTITPSSYQLLSFQLNQPLSSEGDVTSPVPLPLPLPSSPDLQEPETQELEFLTESIDEGDLNHYQQERNAYSSPQQYLLVESQLVLP